VSIDAFQICHLRCYIFVSMISRKSAANVDSNSKTKADIFNRACVMIYFTLIDI